MGRPAAGSSKSPQLQAFLGGAGGGWDWCKFKFVGRGTREGLLHPPLHCRIPHQGGGLDGNGEVCNPLTHAQGLSQVT